MTLSDAMLQKHHVQEKHKSFFHMTVFSHWKFPGFSDSVSWALYTASHFKSPIWSQHLWQRKLFELQQKRPWADRPLQCRTALAERPWKHQELSNRSMLNLSTDQSRSQQFFFHRFSKDNFSSLVENLPACCSRLFFFSLLLEREEDNNIDVREILIGCLLYLLGPGIKPET